MCMHTSCGPHVCTLYCCRMCLSLYVLQLFQSQKFILFMLIDQCLLALSCLFSTHRFIWRGGFVFITCIWYLLHCFVLSDLTVLLLLLFVSCCCNFSNYFTAMSSFLCFCLFMRSIVSSKESLEFFCYILIFLLLLIPSKISYLSLCLSELVYLPHR